MAVSQGSGYSPAAVLDGRVKARDLAVPLDQPCLHGPPLSLLRVFFQGPRDLDMTPDVLAPADVWSSVVTAVRPLGEADRPQLR